MSAELYTVSEPGGNHGSHQGSTVGASKPLHRFLKGEPKIVGIIVLVLGASFFIVSIAVTPDIHNMHVWLAIPPGFLMGTMLIICGILYILTDHNPTKKTVTISLSLSIISILMTCWILLLLLPDFGHYLHYNAEYIFYENHTDSDIPWASRHEHMGFAFETVFMFYTFVGGIISIVMSALAGAALRSTKTQATVVMTTTSTETPVE